MQTPAGVPAIKKEAGAVLPWKDWLANRCNPPSPTAGHMVLCLFDCALVVGGGVGFCIFA